MCRKVAAIGFAFCLLAACGHEADGPAVEPTVEPTVQKAIGMSARTEGSTPASARPASAPRSSTTSAAATCASAPSAASSTRAVGDGEFGLDNTALQAAGFGVFCWYKNYMLMRNQKVEYVATASQPFPSWTYSPAKYWPMDPNEKLTFRAYAPYTSYIYTAADGLPRLPVVVAPTDYHDGTQHDPLYGTTETGELYDDYTYGMSGDALTADARDGIIDWYFHHGMTKLLFRGLVSSDYKPSDPNYKFRITSITLTPLYTEGLLDIAHSTATDHDDKPQWEERDGTMAVTLADDDLLDMNLYREDDQYVYLTDNGLLIIPRDYSAEGHELQLSITYETENPATTKTVTGTVRQHLYGNTVYTIQLLFNPTNSTVNVILSVNLNWQTGSYNLIEGL